MPQFSSIPILLGDPRPPRGGGGGVVPLLGQLHHVAETVSLDPNGPNPPTPYLLEFVFRRDCIQVLHLAAHANAMEHPKRHCLLACCGRLHLPKVAVDHMENLSRVKDIMAFQKKAHLADGCVLRVDENDLKVLVSGVLQIMHNELSISEYETSSKQQRRKCKNMLPRVIVKASFGMLVQPHTDATSSSNLKCTTGSPRSNPTCEWMRGPFLHALCMQGGGVRLQWSATAT